MNNGKICVSVCAETADELIEQIKRAEELADVIEIRFDCLQEIEFDSALRKIAELSCKKNFLATFRPKNVDSDLTPAYRIYENEEEKVRHLAESRKRLDGWERILNIENIEYVDFEYDIHSRLCWNLMFINFGNVKLEAKQERRIAAKLKELKIVFSEHYFLREDIDLEETFSRLAERNESSKDDVEELGYLNPSIIKIAAQADDITDSIAVWKLLEKAKAENKKIVPIAMGESGKWTRILGLANGAFMTYAALHTGSETAPGQISARDLIEVYRIKELNEETKVYGIVGGNTSYSMSPYIHNAAFGFHKLNSVFLPLQVSNLEEFMRRMVYPRTREIDWKLRGFAVTIPHKIEIIKHLSAIDKTAEKIGAVNTVIIVDDEDAAYGCNTDAEGFIQPLHNMFGTLASAKTAVLGAGGAARAVCYALKKAGAEVTVFARNPEKAKALETDFNVQIEEFSLAKSYGDFDILVNTTPLGMKGKAEGETPATAKQLEGLSLVYDLVYTPFQTRLLSEADKAGVPKIGGFEMLIAQATVQQELWSGLDAPIKEMSAAALQRLS